MKKKPPDQNKKQLKPLISDLNTDQKGGNIRGSIRNVHFQRQEEKNLQASEKVLDSMARIIAGESVGAICYDGKKFLVSANEDKSDVTGKYFDFFKDIASGSNKKESINSLEKQVFSNIVKRWQKKAGRRGDARISITIKTLKRFKENNELETAEKQQIQKLVDYLDKNLDLKNASIIAGKILEGNIISGQKNQGLKTAIEDMYRTKQDLDRVISYVENNQSKFNATKPYLYVKENQGIHAEMKIINQLIKDNNIKSKSLYIGDTKLCCASCKTTVDIVNEVHGSNIKMSGTHAKFDYPWPIPEFVSNNNEISNKLFGKLKEYQEIAPKYKGKAEFRALTPPPDDEEALKGLIGQNKLKSQIETIEKLFNKASEIRSKISFQEAIGEGKSEQEADTKRKEKIESMQTMKNNTIKKLQPEQYEKYIKQLEGVINADQEKLKKLIEQNNLKSQIETIEKLFNKAGEIRSKISFQEAIGEGKSEQEADTKREEKIESMQTMKNNTIKKLQPEQYEKYIKQLEGVINADQEKLKKLIEQNKLNVLQSPQNQKKRTRETTSKEQNFKDVNFQNPQHENEEPLQKKQRMEYKNEEEKDFQGSSSKHLKNTGKKILSDSVEKSQSRSGTRQYNFQKRLEVINNDNKDVIRKLTTKSVVSSSIEEKAIRANPLQKDIEKTKVSFLAEVNHSKDHDENVKLLIDDVKSGKIGKDTVIAMERKQYGNNLGVKDVILIANIMDHNEKNPKNQIKLPDEIQKKSLIYHDALLYKECRKRSIKIIGLEGKNLKVDKNSPQYNQEREQYMSKVIHNARENGYNVVAHVGSAHVENLQKMLSQKKKINKVFDKKGVASSLIEIKNQVKNSRKIVSGTPVRNSRNLQQNRKSNRGML